MRLLLYRWAGRLLLPNACIICSTAEPVKRRFNGMR